MRGLPCEILVSRGLTGNYLSGTGKLPARFAKMDPVVVARPGVRILDEGVENGSSAAQVQTEQKALVQSIIDRDATPDKPAR